MQHSLTHDYLDNIHIGVVRSLTEADRHQRSFLQMSNRTRDILRHGKLRRSYVRGILRRRNSSPVSSRSEEEVLSGATATVQLSSGEIVEVPVEYASPAPYEPRSTSLAAEDSPNREPEPHRDAISEEPEGEARVRTEISPMREESSEVEEQTEDAEAGDQTTPEMQMDSEEETMEEQTLSWQILGVSSDITRISMRAMMRARLEMNQLQRHMEIAHQSGVWLLSSKGPWKMWYHSWMLKWKVESWAMLKAQRRSAKVEVQHSWDVCMSCKEAWCIGKRLCIRRPPCLRKDPQNRSFAWLCCSHWSCAVLFATHVNNFVKIASAPTNSMQRSYSGSFKSSNLCLMVFNITEGGEETKQKQYFFRTSNLQFVV